MYPGIRRKTSATFPTFKEKAMQCLPLNLRRRAARAAGAVVLAAEATLAVNLAAQGSDERG
jgi:hypothetical protein